MNDFTSERDYEARGFHTEHEKNILKSLVLSNIKMLNSLLEANKGAEIYKSMGESIDFVYLIDVLSDIFWKDLFSKEEVDEINKIPSHSEKVARLSKKLRENSCLKEGDEGTVFNEQVSEAFNIFFFIETINNELDANEVTNKYREKKKEMEEKEKIAYDVFTANSAHIEIEFNDNLHKVYFMIQPACRY
jgi:hypothetical protein